MNKKLTSAKEKNIQPPTQSRTFRLRADEIQFLESLSDKNITAGIRKLITFGRAIGCSSTLVQTGGADITLAMLARIERLERIIQSAAKG